MLIPILIFVICIGGGAAGAAHWLPDLGPGSVARLAFFVVCGLLAAALGIAGLNIYEVVRGLGKDGLGALGSVDADIIANRLRLLLLESGTLLGLAAIVYLLTPRIEDGRLLASAQAAEQGAESAA